MTYTFSFIEDDDDLNKIRIYESKHNDSVSRIFENFDESEFIRVTEKARDMGYDKVQYLGKATDKIKVLSENLNVKLVEADQTNGGPISIHVLYPLGFLPFTTISGKMSINANAINDYHSKVKQAINNITVIAASQGKTVEVSYGLLATKASNDIYAPTYCAAASSNFINSLKISDEYATDVTRYLRTAKNIKEVISNIKGNILKFGHYYIMPEYYKGLSTTDFNDIRNNKNCIYIQTKVGQVKRSNLDLFRDLFESEIQKYNNLPDNERNGYYERYKQYIDENNKAFDSYITGFVYSDIDKLKKNSSMDITSLFTDISTKDDRQRTGFYKHSKDANDVETYWQDDRVDLDKAEGGLSFFDQVYNKSKDIAENKNGARDKEAEKLHNWKYWFTDKAGIEVDKKKPRFDVKYYLGKGYPRNYAYKAYKLDVEIWEINEKINELKLTADTLKDKDDPDDIKILADIKSEIDEYQKQIEGIEITQQSLIEVKDKSTVDSYAEPKINKASETPVSELNTRIAILYNPNSNKELRLVYSQIVQEAMGISLSQVSNSISL